MKKIILNEYFLISILSFLIIVLTIFQSSNQDYTSVIDFDLTVIHNSLQIISNKYPDFRDHTSYSHFLIYGIFYKLYSFFDQNLITDIDLLVKTTNPEIVLQKLYVISRVVNSIIHLIMIIFFYKLLGIFNINYYYKILTVLFLICSETFVANLTILRSDIVAVCYFYLSYYFLLKFANDNRILNLVWVSLFMILSLLAKVQIIFLFMFIFLFFIVYASFKKAEAPANNFFLFFIKKNSTYILLFFILIYFLFQIFLNNLIKSTSKVGYLDLFLFTFFFFFIFSFIFLICKINNFSSKYFYYTYSLIIFFSLFHILILNILGFFNYIKIDFNILFSITNPFYFLKIYSPLSESNLTFFLIIDFFLIFFKNFNINLVYLILLLTVFLITFFKVVFFRNFIFNISNYFYIFLFICFTLFLISINNFRYNIFYDIYSIPFLFLLTAIFLQLFIKRIQIGFSVFIIILIIYDFKTNLNNYKTYIFKQSNLSYVCLNKPVRDFYYNWARNFDEIFFKKICLNKNLIFN
jgi:hypothetical protein